MIRGKDKLIIWFSPPPQYRTAILILLCQNSGIFTFFKHKNKINTMTRKHLIIVLFVLFLDYLIAQYNKEPPIRYRKKLPFRYNAQTLPPFAIYIQQEDRGNTQLLDHEKVHWQQYRKTGAILFYIRYFFEKITKGYDKMPLEIEARKAAGETEYCQKNYTECVRNGQSVTVKDANFRL